MKRPIHQHGKLNNSGDDDDDDAEPDDDDNGAVSLLYRRVMILLEVTVIASGGEVQGRIGAPQPLRATNADSTGPSSNQMQASAAPQNNSATGVY